VETLVLKKKIKKVLLLQFWIMNNQDLNIHSTMLDQWLNLIGMTPYQLAILINRPMPIAEEMKVKMI